MQIAGADSNSTGLKAIARRVMLPDATGHSLSGYDGVRRAKGQSGVLEANLVAIEDQRGARAFVISLDVLFAGAPIVCAAREAAGNIPLIIAASHTHFAPATDPAKPRLGPYDAGWTNDVAALLAETIQQILREPFVPVRLSCAERNVPAAINRRRRVFWPYVERPATGQRTIAWFRTEMAPNAKGPTDPMLRLCNLTGPDGRLIAQIWNWACHPTSEPDSQVASPDYIGDVRDALRLRPIAEPDLPIVHLQGFCGDLRPPGGRHRRWAGWRRLPWLLRSFLIPGFNPMTSAERKNWGAGITAGAIEAADNAQACSSNGHIRAAQIDLPLAAFLDGAPEMTMPCALLQLGHAVTLAAMACEPSTELGPVVRQAIEGKADGSTGKVWLVGYAGDAFGYLPVDAHVPQRGYEVDGYMPKFSMSGRYARSIDGAVAAVFEKLAAELE